MHIELSSSLLKTSRSDGYYQTSPEVPRFGIPVLKPIFHLPDLAPSSSALLDSFYLRQLFIMFITFINHLHGVAGPECRVWLEETNSRK